MPVNSTRRTRSVDEEITRYDENRHTVPNELEPVYMTGIGATPSHEQITDGLVLDAADVDALPDLSPAAAPLAAAAGPRATVRRPQPDEIQITNDIPPESFGSGHAAGGEQVKAQAVRTFRGRGQKYVLERVEVAVTRQSAGGTRVRERQVSRVRLLRYHENPHRDRERRERRRGRPAPTEMMPQEYQDECAVVMSWSVGTATSCEPPPPPPEEEPPGADPCPQVYSGVNVLFQHGFASGGSTWWRMDEWVRCEFQTNLHIRPTLDWVERIPAQRDELLPYLPPYGSGTVLVGHSNGGLVARSLAQWAQINAPGRVRGVVTLDSPNRGAIVAINMQVVEGIIGTLLLGTQWPVIDMMVWQPVWEDDTPFSPFISRTNDFDETFTRVGIQTHMSKRWSLFRIISNTLTECTPDSSCGERAVKRWMQERYDRHRHCSRFWYRPWQSLPALASMLAMNSMDAAWNGLTAPLGTPSDGLIHGPGQVYPRALRNRLIPEGDSHTGTTRSPYVWEELADTFEDRTLFSIPIRP